MSMLKLKVGSSSQTFTVLRHLPSEDRDDIRSLVRPDRPPRLPVGRS